MGRRLDMHYLRGMTLQRCLLFLWLLLALIGCERPAAEPRVLFLRGDPAQLFVHNLTTGEETQLTDAPFGLFDFVESDGNVITVQEREDGGADLWLLELNEGKYTPLVECPQVRCDQPSWSADGRRVIYVQRSPLGETPRLYWLDSQTGETTPVFSEPNVLGYLPRLSADDRYLSFVSFGKSLDLGEGHSIGDGHNHDLQPNTQQVIVYDFETGRQIVVPNRMNSAGTWQPTGAMMLFSDLQFFGERFGIHLLTIDLTTGDVSDISDARLVEDGSPEWSADGQRIVFTRALATTAMGRQIWLMDVDGGNQVQLTENANWHHGQPLFSADSSQLLFQRFDTTQPTLPPQIWIMDIATGEERLIGEGNRPKFLP